MSHPFRFDCEKALQATAYLLSREPGDCMNYMRLIKILYIADREALRDSGAPITGSNVIAMERGPVLEDVYALIKGEHESFGKWSSCVQRHHFTLSLKKDPGCGRLNRFALSKLDEVSMRYQDDDEWCMVGITHNFPEWKKNDPGNSWKPIPLADILEAVGRGKDLERITDEAERASKAADFFGFSEQA